MWCLTCSQIWFIPLVDDCHCDYITKLKNKTIHLNMYMWATWLFYAFFKFKKDQSNELSYVTSKNIKFFKWNDICLLCEKMRWNYSICKKEINWQMLYMKKIDAYKCETWLEVFIYGRDMRCRNLLNVCFVKVVLVSLFFVLFPRAWKGPIQTWSLKETLEFSRMFVVCLCSSNPDDNFYTFSPSQSSISKS